MRTIIFSLALMIVCAFYINAQADDFGPLLSTHLIVHGTDSGPSGPGDSRNWPSDIVFNGEQYLIVWPGQEGTDSICSPWPCSDIFGRIISASGEFITELLEISCKRANAQLWPSAASNGATFLVVWLERASDDPGSSYFVKGQLVTRTGDLLGREITISNTSNYIYWVAGYDVASDGNDYMVVWSNGSYNYGDDIICQKVKGNGTLDGSQLGVEIWDGTRENSTPSIIYGAGKYFVMWESKDPGCSVCDCDLKGAIIDAASGNLESGPFPVATGPSSQSSRNNCGLPSRPGGMSFDGTNFIVVWHDGRDLGVHARRVSPDGTLLDVDPEGTSESMGIFVGAGANQDGDNPQVSFDGSNWLVTWPGIDSLDHAIIGARIASDGTVLDPDPLVLKTDQSISFPTVASDGTNSMVTWDSGTQVKAQLFGSGIPRASADIPFINLVGEQVVMDGKYSFSPSGNPLTYHWNFGDGSLVVPTTDSVVSHIYSSAGGYTVNLEVDDGLKQSNPFVKTIAVNSTSGGGQQQDVNDFITFIDPAVTRVTLPAGTLSYEIKIVYGPTIDPYSFEAALNRQSLDVFHPVRGTVEVVTIPLSPGRNVLKVSVEGIKPPSQIAKDQDTLTFIVE